MLYIKEFSIKVRGIILLCQVRLVLNVTSDQPFMKLNADRLTDKPTITTLVHAC